MSFVDLVLPVVVSAAAVWVVSFIVWAVLPHHRSDYRGFPDEAAVREAMQPQNLEPGLYNIPHLESRSDLKKPEVRKLFEDGPAGFFTVMPRGLPAMGKAMWQSFVFYLAVGVMVAYLASRTLDADAEYLAVFRVTGTVAWLAYGAAIVPEAIWFGRPWQAIWKHLADALLYALVTAGIFGSMWQNM